MLERGRETEEEREREGKKVEGKKVSIIVNSFYSAWTKTRDRTKGRGRSAVQLFEQGR